MQIYKSWHEYLKFKRLENNMTVNEIAEKLQISASLYKKVESGEARPSLSLFQRLYKLLSLDEITCVVLMKQDYANEQGSVVLSRRTK